MTTTTDSHPTATTFTFPAVSKPWLCAAKDESRYAITHAVLHRDANGDYSIRATDGRRATVIPLQLVDGPAPSFEGVVALPTEVLKAAIKLAKKEADAILILQGNTLGTRDGSRWPIPTFDGRFPEIDSVRPTGEPEYVMTLNGKYLAECADALGAPREGVEAIRIEFHGDSVPMLVQGIGSGVRGWAALMPVSQDESDEIVQTRAAGNLLRKEALRGVSDTALEELATAVAAELKRRKIAQEKRVRAAS